MCRLVGPLSVLLFVLLTGCSWILPLGSGADDDGPVRAEGAGQEGVAQDVGDGVLDGVPLPDGSTEKGADLDGTGPRPPEAGPEGSPSDCLLLLGCDPYANQWCDLSPGVPNDILGLAGPDLQNLWAVGKSGLVLRFKRDTCNWDIMPVTVSGSTISATLNDVWVTVTWPLSIQVDVVGDGGMLLRWMNNSWDNLSAALITGSVYAIADASGTLYAGGAQGVLVKKSGGWDFDQGLGNTVRALSAGPGAVFAAGELGLLEQKDASSIANSFSVHACVQGGDVVLYGLWSTGVLPTSTGYALVAVGENTKAGRVAVFHDGGVCNPITELAKPAWRAVDGYAEVTTPPSPSPQEVWMVGDSGNVAHYEGTTSKPLTSPCSTHLNAVWVNPITNPKLVVVAGDGGQIWARAYP